MTRLDRFAVLVHEIRSPVAALTAMAGAARNTSRAERKELVRLCLSACASIDRLVTDMAVASVRGASVDVGALARDAGLARTLSGNPVEVTVAPALPHVQGDPVRLRQALDNLLDNAVLHAASSGAITVSVQATRTAVVVSVTDAGPGIPASELDSVFDAGVRLDPSRRGAGLGLAITKAVVDAHGGSLTVDSPPGRGATFAIALPRADGRQPDT